MSTGRPHTTGKVMASEENETSPTRNLSKTQPPANRVLDFAANGVLKSIESTSPFKPRKVLRRSMGSAAPRPDPFAQDGSPARSVKPAMSPIVLVEEDEREEVEAMQPADDAPGMFDDDGDEDAYLTMPEETMPEETVAEVEEVPAEAVHSSPTRRKPGRPRKSIESANASHVERTSPAKSVTPTKKRDRTSMESENAEGEDSTLQMRLDAASASPAQKRPRGRPPKNKLPVHREEQDDTIDPQLLTHSDEYPADEPREESVQPQTKGKAKKSKTPAPKERDPNRSIRAATSPVKLHDGPARGSKSPSKRAPSRGGSLGPVSNVNFRASTPFEDAGERVSRYGRPVLKPLQFWANETRVWKNGECEGIIRAEEVARPKQKSKRGRKKKPKKSVKGISRLEDIDEESETESTCADEWEEEVGVIAGTIANWDAETQMGDPNDTVREGTCTLSTPPTAPTQKPPETNTCFSFNRSRLRLLLHHHPRRRGLGIQVREDHDAPLLRLRRRRAPTGGLQAREELAQDADVLLRARGEGDGGDWGAGEWAGESVRYFQGRGLGRASR